MQIKETFRRNGRTWARVLCPECGKIVERYKENAIKQLSCGCVHIKGSDHHLFKHGKSPKQLYSTWKGMQRRCNSPKDKHFDRYGQRGIYVSYQWEKYLPFRDWAIANGWKKGLEIDRKDNDGDYTPDNCRFVSRAINCQNRSNNKLSPEKARKILRLLKDGVKGTEIGRMFNVSSTMVYKIRDGKSWFEGGKAPYPVYRVSDNSLVEPLSEEV